MLSHSVSRCMLPKLTLGMGSILTSGEGQGGGCKAGKLQGWCQTPFLCQDILDQGLGTESPLDELLHLLFSLCQAGGELNLSIPLLTKSEYTHLDGQHKKIVLGPSLGCGRLNGQPLPVLSLHNCNCCSLTPPASKPRPTFMRSSSCSRAFSRLEVTVRMHLPRRCPGVRSRDPAARLLISAQHLSCHC